MTDYRSEKMPPQVWAYYHPFYGTPTGPAKRWLTWNEPLRLGTGYGAHEVKASKQVADALKHDPERFLSPGRRDNYSAFYPTLGLYDSLDPKVLEQHGRWAVEANLDGLIWDYMLAGDDNPDKSKTLRESTYDKSLRLMLDIIKQKRLPLSLSILYDTYCWYGFTRRRICDELTYLSKSYLGNPFMWHIDGRLVVFLYSCFAKHTVEDWQAICSMLEKTGIRRNLFLVAGEVWVWKPDFNVPGMFDGFGAYNQGVNFLDGAGMKDLAKTLKALAELNGVKFYTGAAQAGFDGRVWHHPGRVVARQNGELYETLWKATIECKPPVVAICSFNEWGEGTQIEPTQEYGMQYIELTAKWAKEYRKTMRNKGRK